MPFLWGAMSDWPCFLQLQRPLQKSNSYKIFLSIPSEWFINLCKSQRFNCLAWGLKSFCLSPPRKQKRNLPLPHTVVHLTSTFLFLDECYRKKDKQKSIGHNIRFSRLPTSLNSGKTNNSLTTLFYAVKRVLLFHIQKRISGSKIYFLKQRTGKKSENNQDLQWTGIILTKTQYIKKLGNYAYL